MVEVHFASSLPSLTSTSLNLKAVCIKLSQFEGVCKEWLTFVTRIRFLSKKIERACLEVCVIFFSLCSILRCVCDEKEEKEKGET